MMSLQVFTLDDFYYCDNSNVNYAEIPIKTVDNLYAVASILNSTVFSVLATASANKQSKGYYKLNKQYLEPVLFPAYIFEDNKQLVKELAKKGREIEEKQAEYICTSPHKQKRLKKKLTLLWNEIDQLTSLAYKLTEEQEIYFNKIGRKIDRNKILDNIL